MVLLPVPSKQSEREGGCCGEAESRANQKQKTDAKVRMKLTDCVVMLMVFLIFSLQQSEQCVWYQVFCFGDIQRLADWVLNKTDIGYKCNYKELGLSEQECGILKEAGRVSREFLHPNTNSINP